MLLVKPALPSLDILAAARARFDVPIGAYQVSGEYASIEAAAERGWLDRRRALTEAATSILRAGAGFVITYAAADLAAWAREACADVPTMTATPLPGRACATGPPDLFPGGVNSPVRAFRSVGRPPLILDRGEARGSATRTAPGTSTTSASWGPAILGHAAPAVVEAVLDAALDGFALGATGPREIELGERIRGCDALDGAAALRVLGHRGRHERHPPRARRDRPRPHRQVRRRLPRPRRQPAGRGRVRPGDARHAGLRGRHRGRRRATRSSSRTTTSTRSPRRSRRTRAAIAAVIVEPVGANVGVIAPEPGFLEGLRAQTAADGALLIFDEVITGFRVARGGAQARYGVVAGPHDAGQDHRRRDAGRRLRRPGRPDGATSPPKGGVYQAGTLSGHPLSMAAGDRDPRPADARVYEVLEATGAALEAGLRRCRRRRRPRRRDRPGRVAADRLLPARGAAQRRRGPGTSDRDAYARFFGAMLDDGRPPRALAVRGLVHLGGPRRGGGRGDPGRGPQGIRGMTAEVLAPELAAPATRPDARYLRAARSLPVDATPVWFMRQAGRALPEYRRVRERATLVEITRDPALCAEVTLQPVRRLGRGRGDPVRRHHDAARRHGRRLRHHRRARAGHRARPIRTLADVEALRPFEPEGAVAPLLEAIGLVRAASPVPLIGFAGAPFTLACYLVEGGPSREFLATPAPDARGARDLGRAARPPGRRDGRLPAGAGRGGSARPSRCSTPGSAACRPSTTSGG